MNKIEGQPLLYSVETREFPGKVRLRFVTFTTEVVPMDEFKDRQFQLVDRADPRIREFLSSQVDK